MDPVLARQPVVVGERIVVARDDPGEGRVVRHQVVEVTLGEPRAPHRVWNNEHLRLHTRVLPKLNLTQI